MPLNPWAIRQNRRPLKTAWGPRVPVIPQVIQLPEIAGSASVAQKMLARVMDHRGIRYRPEVAHAGGRGLPGGQVIDFILLDYKVYLRVQGDYWHSQKGQMARDDIQKIVLEGQKYRVVDIWVSAILRNPEQAFNETAGQLV